MPTHEQFKLTDDPFVDGARGARLSRIRVDEVPSPPKRQRLTLQIKTLHECRDGSLQKVLGQLLELFAIRRIECVD